MSVIDLTRKYSESFDALTDAEKQAIRNKTLSGPAIGSLIADKIGAQDAFRGLTTDLLKTTINKLKEQKARESQLDMFKGLPGFSEIANMGGSLSNSILGELGGAAGMAGVDAGALFGGEDGLDFYQEFSKQIYNKLKKGGYLILEIGGSQFSDCKEIFRDSGLKFIKKEQDLQKKDRIIIFSKL